MVARFDYFDRYETPQLILCNPGSTYSNNNISLAVGEYGHTSDLEIQLEFNDISTIKFRLYDMPDDAADYDYAHMLFEQTECRRYIYIPDIGFFVIAGCDKTESDAYVYKDVTAKSCDSEIANTLVPYLAAKEYPLRTQTDGTAEGTHFGILDIVVSRLINWSIGHVDNGLGETYRYISDIDIDTDAYTFLTENIQDAYECIVLFDILNRTVNVYSKETYLVQTDIHLTQKDFVRQIKMSETPDNLFTALRVTGEYKTATAGNVESETDSEWSGDSDAEGLGIAGVNPIGTNVIYDFSHFLSWMTPTLATKVASWQTLVENSTAQYSLYTEQASEKLLEVSDAQAEVDRLGYVIDVYNKCLTNISQATVEAVNLILLDLGGDEITYYENVQQLIDEINALIASTESDKDDAEADLETKRGEYRSARALADSIIQTVAFETYFTLAERKELSLYVFEGSYSDEYVIATNTMTIAQRYSQMALLKSRAKKLLNRVSQPMYKFDIDTESFAFERKFSDWAAQLQTGCVIDVEIEPDECTGMFLSGMDVNYDEKNIKLRFSSEIDKNSIKSLFDDLFKDIKRTANSVSFY